PKLRAEDSRHHFRAAQIKADPVAVCAGFIHERRGRSSPGKSGLPGEVGSAYAAAVWPILTEWEGRKTGRAGAAQMLLTALPGLPILPPLWLATGMRSFGCSLRH